MGCKVHVITALREAAAVKRCHTVPHHGTYTNGHHAHNMMDFLLVLHPNPPMNLIRAVQWHDMPERWLGDIPSPVKDRYTGIGELESHIFSALQLGFSLTADERWWLTAIDKLDLFCWANEQMMMGNQMVGLMVNRLTAWFASCAEKLPQPVKDYLNNYECVRLADDIPGL